MIIKKLKQIFLYAGCESEEQFQSIIEDIHKKNFSILKPMSLIITLFMIILYFLAFKSIILEYSIHIYSIYALLFGIRYILIGSKPENYNANGFFIMYLFICVLYSFGILNEIVMGYDKQAASIIAMLILIPILFIDRPIRMHGISAFIILSFIFLEIPAKKGEILRIDIINIIVFQLISMLLSYHVVKIHLLSLISKNKMKELNQYDSLTGLKNKNAFEQNLPHYCERVSDNIACIYLDISGLQKINNMCDYEAGNTMLKFIAAATTQIFGSEDVYRIGGDEYICFVIDSNLKEIRQKIEKLQCIVQQSDYNISIGMEMQYFPHLHIKNLIVDAENKIHEKHCHVTDEI